MFTLLRYSHLHNSPLNSALMDWAKPYFTLLAPSIGIEPTLTIEGGATLRYTGLNSTNTLLLITRLNWFLEPPAESNCDTTIAARFSNLNKTALRSSAYELHRTTLNSYIFSALNLPNRLRYVPTPYRSPPISTALTMSLSSS